MREQEVRYAKSGDVSIAYQVTGDGPFDLLLISGFISHLEIDWHESRHARFLDRLSSFARLIRFDKRGTGLSDRPSALGGIEARMDDLRAVMDAVGCERAALFAYWEGGPMAALFAATYPERTSALALFGTFARRTPVPDYPWHWPREQAIAATEHVVEVWGTEETTSLENFSPVADTALRRWWITRDRAGATPGAVRELILSNLDIDVRPALPSIQAPTLVFQPDVAADEGKYLAAHIPQARLMITPDDQWLPWLVPDAIDELELFLTGVRPTPLGDRVLATILFTDVVGSTERAGELGDQAWSELLEQHHALVRRELDRFRGEEIDTAGDGFLAVFDGPARAIRCALDIRDALHELGLEIRAGVHTGEVERVGEEKPRGIAVHIAARVTAQADPGQVLVTATTRDLVAGSGLLFQDCGQRPLKGIPDPRHLHSAIR
jgi:class 3 adenylate cyclase/pimeloyl-ACP methyl ester carboxylesterase